MLKIRADGDWVVLRNGEIRGPIKVDPKEAPYLLILANATDHCDGTSDDLSWTANGNLYDWDEESELDIVAVLDGPPYERIQRLEKALKDVLDDLRMRAKPSMSGKGGKVLDISHGVLETAIQVLKENNE